MCKFNKNASSHEARHGSRPVLMFGTQLDDDSKVFAMVTPDGADWDVSVVLPTGEVAKRFVSTIQARPDNGALHVSKMVRQQFGITGIFKVQ